MKYYEELKPGLGLLFIEVIDLLFTRIEKHPLHFQVKHKSIRRAGLEGFPYNVFFRIHKKPDCNTGGFAPTKKSKTVEKQKIVFVYS